MWTAYLGVQMPSDFRLRFELNPRVEYLHHDEIAESVDAPLNTTIIIFNAEFISFNAKFIICNPF